MPQLDTLTFLSQYTWMTLLFLGFYYLLSKYYLPRLSRLLALRQARLQGPSTALQSREAAQHQLRATATHLLRRTTQACGEVQHRALTRGDTWVQTQTQQLQQRHYGEALHSLGQTLGEASLTRGLSRFHGTLPQPPALALVCLLTKLQSTP
jgi:hypothetical protein